MDFDKGITRSTDSLMTDLMKESRLTLMQRRVRKRDNN